MISYFALNMYFTFFPVNSIQCLSSYICETRNALFQNTGLEMYKKCRCLSNSLTSRETKGTQGKKQCQRSVKTKGLEARFVFSVIGEIETPPVSAFSL